MVSSAQLWSYTDNALATFSVALEQETDDGGNVSTVIAARYTSPTPGANEEVYRFSPNSTDADLARFFAQLSTPPASGQGTDYQP